MKPRTEQLLELLKKSRKIEFSIPKDFFDIGGELTHMLNNAIEKLTLDTDLKVSKVLVDDDYLIIVELKQE